MKPARRSALTCSGEPRNWQLSTTTRTCPASRHQRGRGRSPQSAPIGFRAIKHMDQDPPLPGDAGLDLPDDIVVNAVGGPRHPVLVANVDHATIVSGSPNPSINSPQATVHETVSTPENAAPMQPAGHPARSRPARSPDWSTGGAGRRARDKRNQFELRARARQHHLRARRPEQPQQPRAKPIEPGRIGRRIAALETTERPPRPRRTRAA